MKQATDAQLFFFIAAGAWALLYVGLHLLFRYAAWKEKKRREKLRRSVTPTRYTKASPDIINSNFQYNKN